MKARILSGKVLRARHPGAVTQEMWALLTGYQVLRTALTDAVLARPDIPDLIGYVGAAILVKPMPPVEHAPAHGSSNEPSDKYRAEERHPDHRTCPATITTTI